MKNTTLLTLVLVLLLSFGAVMAQNNTTPQYGADHAVLFNFTGLDNLNFSGWYNGIGYKQALGQNYYLSGAVGFASVDDGTTTNTDYTVTLYGSRPFVTTGPVCIESGVIVTYTHPAVEDPATTLGLVLGAEYFLSEKFSLSVSDQVGYTFQGSHKVLSTGSGGTITASVYF